MKRCPTCNRTYTDLSLNFCLEDGTPLATGAPPPDPNVTIRYPGPRDTSEPPPTEIYHPTSAPTQRPTASPPGPPPPPPPQWSPTPVPLPRKKSNALWWILGGLAAAIVIGVGLVVMLIALASLGANTNNSNLNANTRNDNRNSNISANTNTNTNTSNTNANLPGSLSDDFSDQKWGVGTSQFGRIWYDGGEYHMVSKEKTFVVMYAPSDSYNTENARVSVTARSVDGGVPSAGFGLMVHGTLKSGKLEDYALLIYPDDEPKYQIVKHKNGTQTSLVEATKSDAINPGSAPNKLEVRIKGNELSFYANGQFLTRIRDDEDYRRGRAGFYTSDIHEVAFDDLEIDR